MIKKEITFICESTSIKSQAEQIAKVARERGYKIKFSSNKFEKSEIGFYFNHQNFPQFSKFSVILLHDIIQGYSNWPDIWFNEPWHKYNIGILPSTLWVANWNQCSQWFYANPKNGIYRIGWPKADVINELKNNTSKEDFYKLHKLDVNKPTILYAPAWENDHKQDDFVQAMLKLDVNILIKQNKWTDDYPQIQKNIQEMYELHKNNPRVTQLPPETNIFEAIAVSDVLVSEESSTMCEALMMGVPAVSVSNWLIPDVTPSRYPMCDYDFVTLTKKELLTDCIDDIINNYSKYKNQASDFASKTFSNIGITSEMIMDVVDDIISNHLPRIAPLLPNPRNKMSFMRYFKWAKNEFLRELVLNYVVRYKILNMIFNTIHKLHHCFD